MTATIMMVTYNRLDLTKQTLDCIFANTKYPYNLIIIDNHSEDGTFNYLTGRLSDMVDREDSFENYIVVENSENKGIAIGRNQGLFESANFGDEWLVTIDNDVEVPEGWLGEAIDILKANRQYASIGVNFETTNFPFVKLNGHEFQDKPQGNLGTACMVFNRSLHKMLGFFNHLDYGKYGEEDADWGMRTRVVGFKLGYLKTNGKHLGEGVEDTGEYREFKTTSHTNNLAKFNQNCGAYMRREKPIYISFEEETKFAADAVVRSLMGYVN